MSSHSNLLPSILRLPPELRLRIYPLLLLSDWTAGMMWLHNNDSFPARIAFFQQSYVPAVLSITRPRVFFTGRNSSSEKWMRKRPVSSVCGKVTVRSEETGLVIWGSVHKTILLHRSLHKNDQVMKDQSRSQISLDVRPVGKFGGSSPTGLSKSSKKIKTDLQLRLVVDDRDIDSIVSVRIVQEFSTFCHYSKFLSLIIETYKRPAKPTTDRHRPSLAPSSSPLKPYHIPIKSYESSKPYRQNAVPPPQAHRRLLKRPLAQIPLSSLRRNRFSGSTLLVLSISLPQAKERIRVLRGLAAAWRSPMARFGGRPASLEPTLKAT